MKKQMYIDIKLYDDNMRIMFKRQRVGLAIAKAAMEKFIQEKGLK